MKPPFLIIPFSELDRFKKLGKVSIHLLICIIKRMRDDYTFNFNGLVKASIQHELNVSCSDYIYTCLNELIEAEFIIKIQRGTYKVNSKIFEKSEI